MMKLAELLSHRSNLEKKFNALKERLEGSVKHQEGTEPVDNPHLLLEQVSETLRAIREAAIKINRANARIIPGEMMGGTEVSMMELLAERARMARAKGVLDAAIKAATVPEFRFGRQELRMVLNLDLESAYAAREQLVDAHRLLDLRVQRLNWDIEVPENPATEG
jgi:hypothetical protein